MMTPKTIKYLDTLHTDLSVDVLTKLLGREEQQFAELPTRVFDNIYHFFGHFFALPENLPASFSREPPKNSTMHHSLLQTVPGRVLHFENVLSPIRSTTNQKHEEGPVCRGPSKLSFVLDLGADRTFKTWPYSVAKLDGEGGGSVDNRHALEAADSAW